ncbi:hypothetical protein CA14_002278 [Aspergillus flavus]|uniref:Cyanovirin-N domain-containing protein n=1 Tax=Aspergillus flavus TaxID=5059 RepID=A0AB74CP65_ASPFL|nr:hypothetical protein CA14_002278 [Aspergillus flavus]
MRLLLPFLVLPLAALATPFGEPDKPVDPKAGNFSFSCRDIKLDGKPKDDAKPGDALHHLVATCTAGDGTEITSKLDLNHCYSLFKSQNKHVLPHLGMGSPTILNAPFGNHVAIHSSIANVLMDRTHYRQRDSGWL